MILPKAKLFCTHARTFFDGFLSPIKSKLVLDYYLKTDYNIPSLAH